MKDRVVQYPHRYQLVPVAGESDTYDIIAKPGTITEAGTPINKATLLSDATAALYGLTGDDAVPDKAFLNVTVVAQSANKLYGNVTYTDSIGARATLTKNIAIGEGKRFGKCVIHRTSNYGGVFVEFCVDNTKTLMIGSEINSGTDYGSARSRRHLGKVTAVVLFGNMATGSNRIEISEIYINGTNLRIDFKNTSDSSQSLDCTIDWEVW